MIGVILINAMAMKKISTLLLCAAAALLFSACNKQESDVTPVSSGTIRFLAESIETRTAFGSPSSGKYPTLWTANDTKVKVAVNYASSKDATVNPSSDFKTAKFEATLSLPEAGPYTFMSMSPSSAFVAINAEHKSWNVAVPTAQTPLAGSVDEAAQILAAISSEYDEAPQTVKFQFKHVTAYGHFSIKNLNLSGATVQSVSLTSSVPFVGRWYYYPEDGTVEANSASSTITLETSSVSDIWFACAPADLSGATLKVTVATDKGSLEKTVSCPASAKLSGGDVFKFSVDFDGISIKEPQKYILVTDAAELTPNSQVVIAHAGSQKALSTTQNGNNRGAAAVTISNNVITDPADDVQLFLLEEGSVDGSVAFKGINGTQADKYIFAASSSSNYLRSQDNLDANASWVVTIDGEGVTSIVAQGENTRNDIRYNGSNSVFSAYASTSSQEHVSIFKLEGSGGPATEKTPLSAPKNVKASLNADAANAIDVSWDAVSGVNYYEVTATPASGSAVTVQADEEAVTVTDLAYETVYTITVVAYPSDTQKYKKSEPAAAASTVKTGAAAASEHDGSLEDPYTVADAMAETEALGEGKSSSESFYTKGIISEITEVSPDYGNATYFISDDGSTTTQFKVFRGRFIGNAAFTAEDQIRVGDEVLVYGKLTYYKPSSGNSEIEIGSGNYIYELKRGGSVQNAFSASATTTSVSSVASSVKINVYGNVAWTATVTSPGEIDNASGSGQGVITVSIPENTDPSNGRTISVTISSTGFNPVVINITQEKKNTSGVVTITASAAFAAGMTSTAGAQSCTVDGVTIELTNGLANSDQIRIYKNASITITAPSGKNLKKVMFNCTASGTAQYGPGNFAEQDGYTYSGTEGTWEGSSSTLTLTASGAQVRVTSIVVTCE